MCMMSLCETYNSEWRGSVSCKRSRVLQVESVWLFTLEVERQVFCESFQLVRTVYEYV